MALVKCKECGTEISKRAKTCLNCGAPRGPQQYGLGALLVLLVFGVFIYTLFTGNSLNATSTPTASQVKVVSEKQKASKTVINILSISGKSKNEIISLLGNPISCSSPKEHITEQLIGERCKYKKAQTDIVYIDGKADWITIKQLNSVPYAWESALEAIGLPKSRPSFSNAHVIRWRNKNGLLEVSFFPAGNNVKFAHIKSKTK